MWKTISWVLCCVTFLFFTGCASSNVFDALSEEDSAVCAEEVACDEAPAPEARVGAAPQMAKAMAMGGVNGAVRTAAAVPESGDFFTAREGREIAYTAEFRLLVNNFETAFNAIKKMVDMREGMLLNVRGNRLTFRIPAKKADQTLLELKKLGTAEDFRLTSEELTDQIADMNLRMKNMQELHKKLTALLEKAKTVEESLKIEKELSGLTTRIEQLTAQLQNAKKRVAFVTFIVTLQAVQSGVDPRDKTCWRFPWLRELNSMNNLTEKTAAFDVELPDGFAAGLLPFRQQKSFRRSAAVSSDDCSLVLTRRLTTESATLDFWSEVIQQSLREMHGFRIVKAERLENANGVNGMLISAERDAGGHKTLYQAYVYVFERGWGRSPELRIVEFFGPAKAFNNRKASVKDALQTLER